MSTPSDDLSVTENCVQADAYDVTEATLELNRRHASDGGRAVRRYAVWRTINERPGLAYKAGKFWRIPRDAMPRLEEALGLTSPTSVA